MYTILRDNIRKHIEFSNEEFAAFSAPFSLKNIQKRQAILRAGEKCNFEGFVNKGCFRVFYLDERGNENTLYFATEGWWITDMGSFINQSPAILSIEAVEESEVLLITYPQKESLYQVMPKVEKLFRVMTQKTHVALQRRMISYLSKNADKRFLEFVDMYPQLEQRLSQQHIASYLGISHEFLSKIRKKLGSKRF